MNTMMNFPKGAALPVLLILLSAVGLPAFAQWEESILDTLTNTETRKETDLQSLALDVFDQPHAVWREERPDLNGWRLFYSSLLNDGSWQTPQEFADTTRALFSPALTISPDNNRPYVAFVDNNDIFVAQRIVEDEWQVAAVTTSPVEDLAPTITADSSGLLHLAWISQDSLGAYRIAYAVGDSTVWTVELLDSSQLGEFGTGAAPQIAVTPGGIPHIIYRGGDYLNYHIHHATALDLGGERQWEYEILESPNPEDLVGSIAVDPQDGLHVAVAGSEGFGFPSHVYYLHKPQGGVWQQAEEVSAGLSGTNPVIALDPNDRPFVAWMEVSGNFYTGNIFVSGEIGDSWVSTLVAGDTFYFPSFAIDDAGFGHLLFHSLNEENHGNIFYLKSSAPLFGTPRIVISPDSLLFGNVAVEDSAALNLTISNFGGAELVVYSIETPSGFTAELAPGDSLVLAPDSSAEIRVVFRPDSAITYQGFLEITSNATPEPEEVFVHGVGVALSAEDNDMNGIPDQFYLAQNYPNPFNPSTTIEFGVPENAHVEIRVHDLLGREVAVLVDEVMQAGIHRVSWSCRECASGTYLIVLSGPDFSIHQKAILMR